MARYPAIAATSQGILGLLSSAARGSQEFASTGFLLATSVDLQKPPGDQPLVTLYLYQVSVSQVRRNLPARRSADGRLRRAPVPVDLRYLVTAWSRDAATQHQLLGWCIRVLQDTPTLSAALLNRAGPADDAFRPDETVELVWETLTRQELADAWEVAKSNQQPSVAYVARIIEIDSDVELPEPPLVATRELAFVEAGAR